MIDCLFSAKASDIALPTSRFGFGGGEHSGGFQGPSQIFEKFARIFNGRLARRIIAVALIVMLLTALLAGIVIAVQNAPKPAPKGKESASNSSTADAPATSSPSSGTPATSSPSSGSPTTSSPSSGSTSTSSPPAASPPAASPPAAASTPARRSVDCTVTDETACNAKTDYKWLDLGYHDDDGSSCTTKCPSAGAAQMNKCCLYYPSKTVACGVYGADAGACSMYHSTTHTWGNPTSPTCGVQCPKTQAGKSECCYIN